MTNFSLALILHAHLPFVRHPEYENFHEENWFFEALTESYIPLVRMLQRLVAERVPVKLAMSFTPTLCAMLNDSLLRERYLKHLENLIALASRQISSVANDTQPLAEFYRQVFRDTLRTFRDEWNCDLIAAIRELADRGALEIVASAATHGILPLLAQMPHAAEAQIGIGCDDFRENFKREPAAFWLPECAYAPGIDGLLAQHNIRWFVVDAHALEHARPPAKLGTFAPCHTPAGPAAFARDRELSRQVWDARTGYPGNPNYREFYRDIGFDLPAEDLSPFPSQNFTGIKYYRVTGEQDAKQLYEPEIAALTAREHAKHFVMKCIERCENVARESVVLTVPFDAELFGHWWFEGPIFLEQVLRIAAHGQLSLITPGEFLANNPPLQIVQPATSTWGDKGFLDVWLDEKCSWIYAHLYAASRRLVGLANDNFQKLDRLEPSGFSNAKQQALRQVVRELLLAQASDWPFHIRNGTAATYATQRVRDHLARFNRLADSLENGIDDPDFLAECEARDNLFLKLNWRHYSSNLCHVERGRDI